MFVSDVFVFCCCCFVVSSVPVVFVVVFLLLFLFVCYLFLFGCCCCCFFFLLMLSSEKDHTISCVWDHSRTAASNSCLGSQQDVSTDEWNFWISDLGWFMQDEHIILKKQWSCCNV